MNKKAQKQLKAYMKKRGLKPFLPDGGCECVDVPKEELLKTLEKLSEQQTERLKKAGLI